MNTGSAHNSAKKSHNQIPKLISTTINLKDIVDHSRSNMERTMNSMRESYNPYKSNSIHTKLIMDNKRMNSSAKKSKMPPTSSNKKKQNHRQQTFVTQDKYPRIDLKSMD